MVTDDPAAARARVADIRGFHDRIPSNQKIIADEGLSAAVELMIAGVTELMLTQADLFDAEARARTWAAVAQL